MKLDGVQVSGAACSATIADGARASSRWIARPHRRPALCAIAAGVCEEALRITAEYTTTRKQFDRPIGTFQAVGQRTADAYIDTEAIQLTMLQAARRLAEGLPAADRGRDAKFWAAEGGSASCTPRSTCTAASASTSTTRSTATSCGPSSSSSPSAARPTSCSSSAPSSRPNPSDAAPHELTVTRDGLTIAALDWGGDGDPLLLLHPNGFCAGLFHPLALALRDTYRPIAVDLRGQGGTDTPPTIDGFGFEQMARDVLAVLDDLGVEQVVALGESLGGGVCITVDEVRPGFVRRLMLCEAIAFGFDDLPRREPGQPGDGGNYMAAIARKRRAVWPDRETVRDVVRRPSTARRARARGARRLRPLGVPRSCRRAGRAGVRARGRGDAVRVDLVRRRRLAGLAPPRRAHRARGGAARHASDLPGEWFAAQAERAGAPLVTIAGGHFFLQEDTARAEALVREHLPRSH